MKITILLLSLIQIVFGYNRIVKECFKENTRTVPESIAHRGYPVETHYVTTEDGYILTLFRIPNKSYRRAEGKDYPVLLQHGLLSSSATWTLDVPTRTPAFLFADEGYDVWLGNARGCTYSRNHTKFNPDGDKRFWQFSFDEMGYYDVPAVIDYIRRETKKEQIYYVGHSMGTTMFFVGMQLRPQYNKYIKEMFALAPVAKVSHIQTPVRHLAYFTREYQRAFDILGNGEFLNQNTASEYILRKLCSKFDFQRKFCSYMLFLITGSDWHEYDESWLPLAMDEMLSGTSVNTVFHFAQEYEASRFQAFDYGEIENRRRYGTKRPLQYSLENITAPVNLILGPNDYLADPTDVHYLIKGLPNVQMILPVKDRQFNHLDFVWATDMKELVYQHIFERMKSH